MTLDLALLNEDGPAMLRGALDGSWPPALLRAFRRAFPRLRELPGSERLEFLRATAAAEEPEAMAVLDVAAPGEWKVAWEAEKPSAFHVCVARHDGPVRAVAVGEFEGRLLVASGGDDRVVRVRDVFGQPVADLEGHAASVTALAFGVVDGRPVLAGGDHDGTIRTWDAVTGASGFTCDTSAGHPAALAFVEDQDGRSLIAVAIGYVDVEGSHDPVRDRDGDIWGREGRVDLLDAITGELVRELRGGQGSSMSKGMLDLAVAKVGERTLLAALSFSTLYVWDIDTGEQWGSAELGEDWAEVNEEWESFFVPEGFAPPLLVSEGEEGPEVGVVVISLGGRDFDEVSRTVVHLDLADLDEKTLGEEFEHGQGPVAMTSHDGQAVILAANRTESDDENPARTNAVISLPDDEAEVHLDADTRLVTSAAFGSLEGLLHLATAGLDGTVQLWDAQTPHEKRNSGHGGTGLALLTTEQDTPILAVGLYGDTLILLDAASGKTLKEVGCCSYNGDHDCDVFSWADHCCRGLAAGHVAGEPYLASSGCADGTMLWQPLRERPEVARQNGTAGEVTFGGSACSSAALAFGEVDGRVLLAAGAEVRDPVTQERVTTLPDPGFLLSESTFGAAGDQPVLATRRENTASLWNPLTAERLRTFDVDSTGTGTGTGTGAGLAIGRIAGRDVLAVGSGKHVHLWNAATGERLEGIPHISTVTCLTLVDHGDEALMVTGTEDGTVTLWDADSRRRLAVLGAFARPVGSVAATTIDGDLHVYGQSTYDRVIAWRVDTP
ncbi:WD40 repeat domain-containing protein [Spirillospora sp. NPDC048911]|uniref:WD40 repeat domain-containing protein n=1 Tax=Spirillospora sp. NPDC048911 TaxID=3364527 RepID=UPI003717D201